MTDLTAKEMIATICRSLEETRATFARQRRAKRNARIRQIGIMCVVFVTGIAVGALLVTAL